MNRQPTAVVSASLQAKAPQKHSFTATTHVLAQSPALELIGLYSLCYWWPEQVAPTKLQEIYIKTSDHTTPDPSQCGAHYEQRAAIDDPPAAIKKLLKVPALVHKQGHKLRVRPARDREDGALEQERSNKDLGDIREMTLQARHTVAIGAATRQPCLRETRQRGAAQAFSGAGLSLHAVGTARNRDCAVGLAAVGTASRSTMPCICTGCLGKVVNGLRHPLNNGSFDA